MERKPIARGSSNKLREITAFPKLHASLSPSSLQKKNACQRRTCERSLSQVCQRFIVASNWAKGEIHPVCERWGLSEGGKCTKKTNMKGSDNRGWQKYQDTEQTLDKVGNDHGVSFERRLHSHCARKGTKRGGKNDELDKNAPPPVV